ncbi:MAG TPA: hypothetical protein VFE01_09260 [Terracidiphilus sp.]|jgi:hypothetical protein|nr:hypothetical protein [Terracidiphilus sp.]
MTSVVSYVRSAIPQLPNFFATKLTRRFEDTPQLLQPGGAIPYQPFHLIETSNATVLYRGFDSQPHDGSSGKINGHLAA